MESEKFVHVILCDIYENFSYYEATSEILENMVI